MAHRFFALFVLVLRTAGRAAFARAALLYLAIAMVSMIVFAPNAMMASDVTDLAQSSIGFRIVLWSVWLLAATPAARAVLCEPSLFWWRSLPIPRLFFYVAQGLVLALAELPLAILYARGERPLAGIAVLCVNMSLHSLWVSRSRDLPSWIVLFGLPLAVCLPLPLPVLLPLSLLCVVWSLPRAFLAAPHHLLVTHRPAVLGPALLALALTYLVTLWRAHAALFVRACLLLLCGALISFLALRNNQITSASLQNTISLGVLSVTLLLGLSGLAGPVVRCAQHADWLFQVCQRDGRFCLLAEVCALSICGVTLGLLHGILLVLLVGADGARWLPVCASSAALGLLVAVQTGSFVRLALRGNEKDTDRLLLWLCGLIPLGPVLLWMFHELGLLFLLLLATFMYLRAERQASPKGRWQRLLREREQRGIQ